MTYTATQLITEAYYISGIVSPDLQTVSGPQFQVGLNLLNGLLAIQADNVKLIPFFKSYTFPAVIGQQEYFVPNLVFSELLTFVKDTVRFPVKPTNRLAYFATPRANGIESLPGQWHYERAKGGSNIFLYFLPNETYSMEIWGKFALDEVAINDDLEDVYERGYIEYLKFSLAKRICAARGAMFLPDAEQELKKIEAAMIDISPPDLTPQRTSAFSTKCTGSWAYINLSNGWIPR